MNRLLNEILTQHSRRLACRVQSVKQLFESCFSNYRSKLFLPKGVTHFLRRSKTTSNDVDKKNSVLLYTISKNNFPNEKATDTNPTEASNNLSVNKVNVRKKPNFKIFGIFATFTCAACGLYQNQDFLKLFGTVNAFGSRAAIQRNFIADIVDKAGPAVVFIEIKGRHPHSGKRVTLANGSGFLVRSNGLILTNAHVVANKSVVSVKLHNGSTYEGLVTAVDPVCDLATVKIDTEEKLPVIPLGKSSTIRPGEFVAAMGSPLSLHKTVTIGIVSSNLRGSRELGIVKKNMEYIQTDATIGLGNSGGPLVNLDGKAIGINTLKLTEGISFAIPADYAMGLIEKADQLASKADYNKKPNYLPNGKETNKRRYVGITMLPLTQPILMELKDKIKDLPHITAGVYVHKVVVSSPAYAGGLHAGDIIIDINGSSIHSAADVYSMVEKSDMLRITVIRGSHTERFSVVTETL